MISVADLVGVKYKVHGRNKQEGLDCYGLAIEVLKRCGKTLPDVFYENTDRETNIETAKEIEKTILDGLPVTKLEKPEPYCLVTILVCGKLSHIAVYLGNQKIIHSSHSFGVHIQNLSKYENRIEGFYRVN